MAQQLEPLNLKITGSANGLSATIGKSRQDISGFAQNVKDQSRNISASFASLASIALPVGLTGAAGFGIKLAADAQDAELTFKALVGSAEGAKRVLSDLQKFSASTPFEFTQDVKPAAQQLLTYGFTVDELQGQLQILGNVAAVSGADFAELAQLVGRARSTNLVFTEDLNQFSDRAIPVLDLLAQRFGVTAAEVRKLASEGKINFGDLQAVLATLGGEGGKFASAMEERSRTLNGQVSSLKDNFGLLAQEIGSALLPVATASVGKLAEVVDWVRNLDVGTVETTAKIAAFSTGFGVALLVIPKVIAIGRELVLTIRAIATASSLAQALSGPKGWATLAIGLVAAGAAAYGVDQLFDGLHGSSEQLAVSSKEVASGFKEIEKRALESGNAAKEIEKNTESWSKQAATIRDQLASPAEQYTKTLENLSLAVTEGGLEFEFFARGVSKAYDELQRANGAADQFEPPKAVLAGSVEDIRESRKPRLPIEPEGKQEAIAKELADVQQKLVESSKSTAETLATAAIDSSKLNVEKLTAALDEAEKRFEASRKQVREALNQENDAVNAKGGFFARQISGLGELFGNADTSKPRDFTTEREALSSAKTQVETLQSQLAQAQQSLAEKQTGKDVDIAAKLDITNTRLEELKGVLANLRDNRQPLNL